MIRTVRAAAALAIGAGLLLAVAPALADPCVLSCPAPSPTPAPVPPPPPPPSPGPTKTPGYDAAATARLYAEVNAHRAAIGLGTLTVDAALASVAKTYTTGMAARRVLAHNDALFTPASHRSLGIAFLGENVGDTWDAARFTPMFLASPHHRENIESPRFAVAGFAVVLDDHGQYWATEDFGGAAAPRAAAPAPAARPVAATAPYVRPAVASRSKTRTRAVAAPVHAVGAPVRADRTSAADAVAVTSVAAVSPVGAPPARTPWVVVAFGALVAAAGSGAAVRRRGRLVA
jgi:uncharacterized protein YkwD